MSAFELTAGDVRRDVEMLCRHLTRGAGAFSASTIPTEASVERWITLSYHWIRGLLRRNGLSEDQTEPDVVGILQSLQSYDVAIKCEMSQATADISGEPSARFQMFVDLRKELIDLIIAGTLSDLGATPVDTNGRAPILTGQFLDRKQVAEDDTNRTQHRIRRNLFRNPGSDFTMAETDVNQ